MLFLTSCGLVQDAILPSEADTSSLPDSREESEAQQDTAEDSHDVDQSSKPDTYDEAERASHHSGDDDRGHDKAESYSEYEEDDDVSYPDYERWEQEDSDWLSARRPKATQVKRRWDDRPRTFDAPQEGDELLRTRDEWFVFTDALVKRHYIPRRELYMPRTDTDWPSRPRKGIRVGCRRVTSIFPHGGYTDEIRGDHIVDSHMLRSYDLCTEDVGYLWTGYTMWKFMTPSQIRREARTNSTRKDDQESVKLKQKPRTRSGSEESRVSQASKITKKANKTKKSEVIELDDDKDKKDKQKPVTPPKKPVDSKPDKKIRRPDGAPPPPTPVTKKGEETDKKSAISEDRKRMPPPPPPPVRRKIPIGSAYDTEDQSTKKQRKGSVAVEEQARKMAKQMVRAELEQMMSEMQFKEAFSKTRPKKKGKKKQHSVDDDSDDEMDDSSQQAAAPSDREQEARTRALKAMDNPRRKKKPASSHEEPEEDVDDDEEEPMEEVYTGKKFSKKVWEEVKRDSDMAEDEKRRTKHQ